MKQGYQVLLHGVVVGQLALDPRGRWLFRLSDSYRSLPDRPVLGQIFEDDLTRDHAGASPGRLPAFFANLVPEQGQLRDILERTFGLASKDDAGLLAAVGADLPGAVEVRPAADMTPVASKNAALPVEPPSAGGLRFSLAGVQLKFSVVREQRGLTLPAKGRLGEWIVKLPTAEFPGLVENEFTVMTWARAAGFEVPEFELEEVANLIGLPEAANRSSGKAFVIRRFDRSPAGRVHQEDFAQVLGRAPSAKYDEVKYEQIAAVVREVVGVDGYLEFVRRLVLMLAAGNNDAHLKNWSLIYRDRVRAELAPVYDQVSTVGFVGIDRDLALKFASHKSPYKIDDAALRFLAGKANCDAERTLAEARGTTEQLVAAWDRIVAESPMPLAQRASVVDHWNRVPLLRDVARLRTSNGS